MFNVNWTKLIRWLIPTFLRKQKTLAWVDVLISQVKYLHTQFLTYRSDTIYKIRFTSQIIYLEKRLNDKFDNLARGIFINNVADVSRTYLYNKIEGKPKLMLHNKYNPATAYAAGEYAVYGIWVYRALQSTTGNTPDSSPLHWFEYKKRVILSNQDEFVQDVDFVVMVPTTVVFDLNEMKGIVNFYRYAGKRYLIQTY